MEKSTVKRKKKSPSPVGSAVNRNIFLFLRALGAAASVLLLCMLLFDIQWRFGDAQDQVLEIAERPIGTPHPTATPPPVVTPEPEDDTPDEPRPMPRPTPRPRPPKPRFPNERDINFQELSEYNPDIMGWIEIPGTLVDYPVVTTFDNEFYLDHDFFGNRDRRGTIFADIRNNPDWNDPLVVLYGHYTRDGSRLTTIRNFRRDWFLNRHDRIIIYTPDGQLEFRVFAVFVRDDEHLIGTRDFRNPAVMRAYLDEMQDVSERYHIIDLSEVDETDSILALSLCYDNRTKRLIVHAVFEPPVIERDPGEPAYIY